MVMLPGPSEIFEPASGQPVELLITGQQVGELTIHPTYAGAPAQKTIPVLRVFVDPKTKPTGMPYWDITSQTLIAQLRPFLTTFPPTGIRVKVTGQGVAPSKRYTVDLVP